MCSISVPTRLQSSKKFTESSKKEENSISQMFTLIEEFLKSFNKTKSFGESAYQELYILKISEE